MGLHLNSQARELPRCIVGGYDTSRVAAALRDDPPTGERAHKRELPRPKVGRYDPSRVAAALRDDPPTERRMATQIARDDDVIMEDADSGDEETWALIKGLTTTASPYFLNLEDYVNGDRNGISVAPNPTIINSYEKTQYSSLNRHSFPTGSSPCHMLRTSDGVVNNIYATDDVTAMCMRYGVFPFIKKASDTCFHNHQLSHLLSQRLTDSFLQLIDPTGTDQIPDIPMTLSRRRKNITLVLDIDGTLIHSEMIDNGADFSFPMLSGEKMYTVYVKKRPYVDAFLKKVAEMFEIVVFTASISSYANQLLDILDPGNRLISQRYFRDSCLSEDGGKSYLKDLTIIEANLAKVAIIDNTPEVYQRQVNNGIPIKTWSSDPDDVSLPELIPFLKTLAIAADVRPLIARKFANYKVAAT